VPLVITVDTDKCMGSGNCLFWAPGVFDLTENDVATVVDPTAATEQKIRQAVDGCPTQAISVTEAPDAPAPSGPAASNRA
jgi:ferredoxin